MSEWFNSYAMGVVAVIEEDNLRTRVMCSQQDIIYLYNYSLMMIWLYFMFIVQRDTAWYIASGTQYIFIYVSYFYMRVLFAMILFLLTL